MNKKEILTATCKELLAQRGYSIESETNNIIIGVPLVIQPSPSSHSSDSINYSSINKGEAEPSSEGGEYHRPIEKICIFLDNISNDFNVSKSSEYIIKLRAININHCIIIYKEKITSVAKKITESINDFTIELFPSCELMYNITKHYLVPLHKKLEDEASKNFKLKYGINIPIILYKDPVSRFYGFKPNDIIEVTRSTGFVTYRIVK